MLAHRTPPHRQLLAAAQVNFLSHWLLAHELLAEQRRRRAKAARKQGRRNGSANADAGCACGGAVAACKDAGGGANCGTRLVMLSSLTHHAGQLQWHDKEVGARLGGWRQRCELALVLQRTYHAAVTLPGNAG